LRRFITEATGSSPRDALLRVRTLTFSAEAVVAERKSDPAAIVTTEKILMDRVSILHLYKRIDVLPVLGAGGFAEYHPVGVSLELFSPARSLRCKHASLNLQSSSTY
jgi:sirohydrochlorin ferrochelatase